MVASGGAPLPLKMQAEMPIIASHRRTGGKRNSRAGSVVVVAFYKITTLYDGLLSLLQPLIRIMTEPEDDRHFPFDSQFRTHLEYHLGNTFERAGRKEIRGFWCDGIGVPSDQQLSRKHVNDTRQIKTTAYIGYNGQGLYEMTIHLGKYALRRYAKGTSLLDCLPGTESMDWITMDTAKQTIEIQLK